MQKPTDEVSAPPDSSAQPGPTDPTEPMPIQLLGYLVNRLTARINQRWLSELRPHKLTVPRWQVLSILAALDGCRVGQIAELSGQEQPVVSRLIDQMQRDGLVERRKAETDSRVTEVWLCPPGRELLQALEPAAMRYIEDLTEPLDEAEQQTLMNLLGKLLHHVDR